MNINALVLLIGAVINQPNVTYQPEDFYYQEKNGKYAKLSLTKKVLVRFEGDVLKDKRAELLNGLNTSAEEIARLKAELNELQTKTIPELDAKIKTSPLIYELRQDTR